MPKKKTAKKKPAKKKVERDDSGRPVYPHFDGSDVMSCVCEMAGDPKSQSDPYNAFLAHAIDALRYDLTTQMVFASSVGNYVAQKLGIEHLDFDTMRRIHNPTPEEKTE